MDFTVADDFPNKVWVVGISDAEECCVKGIGFDFWYCSAWFCFSVSPLIPLLGSF